MCRYTQGDGVGEGLEMAGSIVLWERSKHENILRLGWSPRTGKCSRLVLWEWSGQAGIQRVGESRELGSRRGGCF